MRYLLATGGLPSNARHELDENIADRAENANAAFSSNWAQRVMGRILHGFGCLSTQKATTAATPAFAAASGLAAVVPGNVPTDLVQVGTLHAD